MLESQVVLLKIGVMFLVMLAGWILGRRGYVNATMARMLGILVVQVTFPALVFAQMLSTISRPALRAGWWLPVLAGGALVTAGLVGYGLARLFRAAAGSCRTFVFLVAVPNWVFLPLPIAEALYGAEGVRFVLLFNFGAQVTLWTVGVRTLAGGKTGGAALRGLLTNPGIVATLAGATVALNWPAAATLGQLHGGMGPMLAADAFVGALRMLGDLTIPLSLLVTGAQLSELTKPEELDLRPLSGVLLGRLLVAPALTLVLLKSGAAVLGVVLKPSDFITTGIIVSMPVAISCSMFIERFGGDRGLGAMGIFYSTLLSLVTVPAVVWVCRLWVP